MKIKSEELKDIKGYHHLINILFECITKTDLSL